METQSAFRNAAARPVLANHKFFRTSDLDEAKEKVSQVFCSHGIRTVGRDQKVDAEMYYRKIRGIGLGRMRYGANVVIDPGRLETFALIQMPLSGLETVQQGTHSFCSNTHVGSVLSPTLPFRMQHDSGTEKLFVRIDRDVLERHCRQHIGGDLRQPVEFAPKLSMDEPRCASWLRLMRWLYDEFGQAETGGGEIHASPLFAAQIEQMVVATLLLTQRHNYSERLADDAPSIAPHFVKRATAFIEDNAHEPLTVGEIVEHVGVSTRSLFAGFRKYRNTTPMEYLKNVRMHRVREELEKASPSSTTITRVAVTWGFAHLGHFTCDYKRYFGESPSVTLCR